MIEKLTDIPWESWFVLGQMAPYLLFGFLMAGVLSVCISPEFVERHLGRRGIGPVLKASLFGVPLPLCSCSVIPVSASIYRHGASRAATTSFLLSTPQTGVDSIAVTWSLLGPVLAIYRPLVAFVTGVLGGGAIQALDRSNTDQLQRHTGEKACAEACCSSSGNRNVVVRILYYGFVVLPRDIGSALLVGILVAGAIAALVDQDQLGQYVGTGILASLAMILVVMAASVPLYVCATASVPIAAGMIHVGVSPGAALAFLIAGPATNAATIATIWKLLGRRAAVIYLTTVAVSAIGSGLLFDGVLQQFSPVTAALGAHAHDAHGAGWLIHLGAISLLAVLALSSKTLSRWSGHLGHGSHRATPGRSTDAPPVGRGDGKKPLELVVTGMTCSHCAETVRRGLTQCEGVDSVVVDLATESVVVAGKSFDADHLMATLEELGYTAKLAGNSPS